MFRGQLVIPKLLLFVTTRSQNLASLFSAIPKTHVIFSLRATMLINLNLNLKTVQDRRVFSVKDELGIACALSDGDIANDLPLMTSNHSKLPQRIHFVPPLIIIIEFCNG